ncbi:hypothetical protein [Peribacillus cavernae]|nr:hypothetical protein [Peribacillus cavernae]MDQ0219580.1 hypothetical protein [Peribacillus cavernae]
MKKLIKTAMKWGPAIYPIVKKILNKRKRAAK